MVEHMLQDDTNGQHKVCMVPRIIQTKTRPVSKKVTQLFTLPFIASM